MVAMSPGHEPSLLPAGAPVPPVLPLADASRRLRKRPGRPPGRTAIERTALETAPRAAGGGHFATTVLPAALPIQATTAPRKGEEPVTTYPATAYSGLAVRTLWRLIRNGQLQVIR